MAHGIGPNQWIAIRPPDRSARLGLRPDDIGARRRAAGDLEIERYGRLVVEPAVPSGVQEIGLRSEPNLELLQSFAPDVIIIDPWHRGRRPPPQVDRAGRDVHDLQTRRASLDTARRSTMELAKRPRPGCRPACEAYFARFDVAMAGYRERLWRPRRQAAYLVSEIARNRALVFGPNSLYQEVLSISST